MLNIAKETNGRNWIFLIYPLYKCVLFTNAMYFYMFSIFCIFIGVFSASAWWLFAINSHLQPIHERNKRRTKSYMTERVKDIVTYSQVYTEHLTSGQQLPEVMVRGHFLLFILPLWLFMENISLYRIIRLQCLGQFKCYVARS